MKLFERKNLQPPTPDQKMSGRKDKAREAQKKIKDKYNPMQVLGAMHSRAWEYLHTDINDFGAKLFGMAANDISNGFEIKNNDSESQSDVDKSAEEALEIMNNGYSSMSAAEPDNLSIINNTQDKEDHSDELILSTENILEVESQIEALNNQIKLQEEQYQNELNNLQSEYDQTYDEVSAEIQAKQSILKENLDSLLNYRNLLAANNKSKQDMIVASNLRPSSPIYGEILSNDRKISDLDKGIDRLQSQLSQTLEDQMSSVKNEESSNLEEIKYAIDARKERMQDGGQQLKESVHIQMTKIAENVVEMLNNSKVKPSLEQLYEIEMVILPKLKERGVIITKDKHGDWNFVVNSNVATSRPDQQIENSSESQSNAIGNVSEGRFKIGLMKLRSISAIKDMVSADMTTLQSSLVEGESTFSDADLLSLKRRISHGVELVANKKIKDPLPEDIKAKNEVFNLITQLSSFGIVYKRFGTEYVFGLEGEDLEPSILESGEATNSPEYIPKNKDQVLIESMKYAPLPESLPEVATWQKQIDELMNLDHTSAETFCILGTRLIGGGRNYRVAKESEYVNAVSSQSLFKFMLPVFEDDNDSPAAQGSRAIIDRFEIRDPRAKNINVVSLEDQESSNLPEIEDSQEELVGNSRDDYFGYGDNRSL